MCSLAGEDADSAGGSLHTEHKLHYVLYTVYSPACEDADSGGGSLHTEHKLHYVLYTVYSPACEDADSGGGPLHPLLLPPQHCLGETCWPKLFMKLDHKIEYFF